MQLSKIKLPLAWDGTVNGGPFFPSVLSFLSMERSSIMELILGVLVVAATGAIFPQVAKRWLDARLQMERLRMQRRGDGPERRRQVH